MTSGADLQVRYVLPPFFHEIPVLEAPEEIAESLYDTARELLPHEGPSQWAQWATICAWLLDDLLLANAVYAGFCVLDMDGRNSTSTITIALTQLPDATAAESALRQTEQALTRAHPQAEIHTLTLPCGQAVAKIDSNASPLPRQVVTEPAGAKIEQGTIQVFIPLPNEIEMLTLELTTPSMQDWDIYSRMFADVVNSVECWHDGDEDSSLGTPAPRASEHRGGSPGAVGHRPATPLPDGTRTVFG